ncbi:hypothetical protein PYCC9005_005546 [Savitreella phatthalungensis]
MSSRLRLLADQLRISILERNRLVLLGVEPSQDDEEEMQHSLETLRTGITHLTDAPREEVATLRQELRELERQFKNSEAVDLESQPYRDDPSADSRSGSGSGSRSAGFLPYHDDPEAARTALLTSSTRKSVRFSETPASPDLASRDVSNEGLLSAQQQMMREQDDSLEVLSRSIGRQRELSIQIGDELDEQGELIDDVDGHVTRSQNRLDQARTRLTAFSRKAKANSHLSIIITLLVVLILLMTIL